MVERSSRGRADRAKEKSWGDGSHFDMSTTHLWTPLSIVNQPHLRIAFRELAIKVRI